MIQIIPAILATSLEQYQADSARLLTVESLRGGWVHFDFMDNKFVLNEGIDPSVTSKYPITFEKEAHLMVQHPREWIDRLVKADFKRVLIHMESDDDKKACLDYAKGQGLEVGLVLNHETPIDKLEPFISKLDVVLFMGVVPGFQGQPFIEGVFQKIKDFKSRKWPVRAGVDGAVSDANIKNLIAAGVDFVIVGSYLLKGDIDENLEKLWEAIR